MQVRSSTWTELLLTSIDGQDVNRLSRDVAATVCSVLQLHRCDPLWRPDGAAGPCCGPATQNVAGITSESIGAIWSPFASSVLLLLTLVPLLVFGLPFPPPSTECVLVSSLSFLLNG